MIAFTPPSEPSADVEAVLDTAAVLDVTEFRVFELAFTDWHGYPPSPRRIEAAFVPYMFQGSIPHWVRQYTRKILRLQRQGSIDRQALGIQPVSRSPRMLAKGAATVIILVFAILGLLVMASGVGELLPFLEGCYFPPCY